MCVRRAFVGQQSVADCGFEIAAQIGMFSLECTAEMKMATPQLNLVAGQTIDVEFSSSYLHGDLALRSTFACKDALIGKEYIASTPK